MKNESKRIVVLGKNGQISKSLLTLSQDSSHKFLFFSSSEMNLLNLISLEDKLNSMDFDLLINCSAYTAVDLAETERDTAYKINATAVLKLAEICKSKGARFLHFSSDYVYGSMSEELLSEESKTMPLNYYGYTKLEGESHIVKTGVRHIILRTSWVYSPWGTNFLKTMIKLGGLKKEISIVDDQIGSPTYSLDIAKAVLRIIDQWNDSKYDGIYNISGSTICSWYDFAEEIFRNAKKYGFNIEIERVKPILSKEYATQATRSANSRMNQNKIKSIFGIHMPYMDESINNCLQILKDEYKLS